MDLLQSLQFPFYMSLLNLPPHAVQRIVRNLGHLLILEAAVKALWNGSISPFNAVSKGIFLVWFTKLYYFFVPVVPPSRLSEISE